MKIFRRKEESLQAKIGLQPLEAKNGRADSESTTFTKEVKDLLNQINEISDLIENLFKDISEVSEDESLTGEKCANFVWDLYVLDEWIQVLMADLMEEDDPAKRVKNLEKLGYLLSDQTILHMPRLISRNKTFANLESLFDKHTKYSEQTPDLEDMKSFIEDNKASVLPDQIENVGKWLHDLQPKITELQNKILEQFKTRIVKNL